MSELKPCPFCGGEAHVYRNHLWHVGCERALNGCVTMSAFVTEAEAVEAWNTRAERTCQREKRGVKMDGSPRLRCSLCGYGIGDKRFNYCPNCGARVEGEER